jgi:hypothetical protein
MAKQEYRDKCFRHMIKEQFDVLENALALCLKQCRIEGQEPNENRLIELICLDFLSGVKIINEDDV